MYASNNALQVDRSQIARQLELLGYVPGEKIFLRAFYPSDDSRKGDGRKAEEIGIKAIAKTAQIFQGGGRGIYFVVNGHGQKDADVKTCRAVFYEHDNLAKDLQIDLWRSLGLPEPTFQVDTGGKSIHSYWVFKEPIDPTRWKSLQTDLLEYSDGDRSLKNPSRVMRLAGCYHLSSKGAFPTTIVTASGTRYSFEQLRAVVPGAQKVTAPLPSTPQSSEDVPLSECLTKSDRELLAGGVSEGGRNDSGAKLTRNLIGTAVRLQYLGFAYSGSPRHLLDDYCNRCSPPLDAKEADQVWKSAEGDNPTASLSDEALENCVKAWQRKQQIRQVPLVPPAEKPLNIINFPQSSPTIEALSSEIDVLASRCEPRSKVRGELIRLTKHYEVSPSEVEKLYRDRCLELEQQEDRVDLVARLPSLVEAQNTSLNLNDFLWGDGGILADSMMTVATEMPTAPEFLFTSFLPVAASRLGTAAEIVVKPSAGFKQPAIIRTCLVAKSGDMKSPPQKAVIKALEELEDEARQAFGEEVKAYEEALKQWKKDGEEGAKPAEPVCKRYILQNGSIESRIAIHAENPRGLLLYRDEWSAHLTGRNKHRKGVGDDAENELTEFDGGMLVKDVIDASKRLFLSKTAISRTGTTQFSKLKELMGEHEDTVGEFGRWLFCVAPCPPCYLDLDNENPLTLTKLLKDLYRNLELMPPKEYLLGASAKSIYQKYHNSLVDLGYSEQNPGIQIALPKLRSYFARFTLLLHCVNQALMGSAATPTALIDDFTVVAASELCSYFLAQLRVVYALNSPVEELSGRVLYLKNWFHGKQDVTARSILKTLNVYKKSSREELQNDLQIILDAGYITQEIKGKAINYSSAASFTPSAAKSAAKSEGAEMVNTNGLIELSNSEVPLSAARSAANLNPFAVGVSADLDPKCRQKTDSPDFDTSTSEVPLNERTDLTENTVSGSGTSGTWGQNVTQQALETSGTCEKTSGTSGTCSEATPEFSEEEIKANAGYIREAIAVMDWQMIKDLADGWEPQFKRLVWRLLTNEEKATVKLLAER